MAMNFTSRITNQSTIYYAQSKGLKVAGLPRSPKAKKDGKFSTKDWVFGSFYSANKISTPASEPALASVKIRSPQRISPTTQQCGTNTAEFRKSRASRNVPTYEGKPAVFFEQSRIDGVAKSEKFKFSLFGKFPFHRPSLEQIRAWVGRELKLKGLWSITLLDSKHVLLRLDNEADMVHVWLRNRWFINGHLMRVFKWTPSFRTSDAEEPSLAAVWISLPLLPVAFFEQNLLYSIASLVGEVLCADGPTKKLSRTNVARVSVEVDLLEELPHRVYIGIGEAGFWQDVSYEKLPFYCAGCWRFGHSTGICKFNKTGLDVDKPLENVVNVISHLEKPNDETKRKDCLDHISGTNLYQTCPVFKCKDVNGNSISGSSPLVGVKQCTAGESSKNRSRLEVVASVGKSWTFEQNCSSSRSNEKTSSNNLAIKDTQTQGTDTQSRTFVLDKADNSQVSVSSHLELKSKTIVEEEDGVDHEIDGDVNNDVGHEVSGGYDSKENQSCRQNTLRETHDALESNSFFKLSVMQSPPSRKKFTLDKSIFFWKRKPKEVHIGPLRTYSLRDLRIATNSFNKKRILGRGGFGKVYKGQLPDGSLVAIKRLKEEMTTGGLVMFQNEVEMCSKAVHRNILQLHGFCVTRNERLLVYPYMVNGSVASRLRERSTNEPPLNWIQRKRIALGTARGLSYLHDHCNPKIIHRDVKAANILLDGNFEAVVGDFGLVKFMNIDDSHLTTAVRGTIGHLPPEYLSTGKITEKCDVFGYGIMLLELISGQRAFDLARLANDDDVMLRDWVKGLLKEQKLDMVLDPDLRSNYLEAEVEQAEVEQLIQIAILCTQDCPIERPKMSEVLTMLEGDGLAERWEEWQKIEEVRQAVELFPQPDSVDSTNSVLSSPR